MNYNIKEDNFEIILFPEDFIGKKVIFKLAESTKIIPDNVASLIELEWNEYKKKEIENNSDNYKNITELLRYEGYQIELDQIIIKFSYTDYKETYGTNIKHPELRRKYGDKALGNAIAASCLIETIDNKFFIMKRSENVLELPGFFHLCAGHLDKQYILSNPSLLLSVKKEISEELFLNYEDIANLQTIGLCISKISFKSDFLHYCKLLKSSEYITMNKLNYEHTHLLFLKNSELHDFLLINRDKMVPACKANIICYLIFTNNFVYNKENI